MQLIKTALLSMLLCIQTATATEVNFITCSEESKALGLCQKLNDDLTARNLLLQKKVDVITQQRDTATKQLEKATEPPLMPAWAWGVAGILIGAGAYAIIRR